MIENKPIYQCLRCGKSWKIHWRKNIDKLPKACRFCKSRYWNTPKKPNNVELLGFLLKIENLNKTVHKK